MNSKCTTKISSAETRCSSSKAQTIQSLNTIHLSRIEEHDENDLEYSDYVTVKWRDLAKTINEAYKVVLGGTNISAGNLSNNEQNEKSKEDENLIESEEEKLVRLQGKFQNILDYDDYYKPEQLGTSDITSEADKFNILFKNVNDKMLAAKIFDKTEHEKFDNARKDIEFDSDIDLKVLEECVIKIEDKIAKNQIEQLRTERKIFRIKNRRLKNLQDEGTNTISLKESEKSLDTTNINHTYEKGWEEIENLEQAKSNITEDLDNTKNYVQMIHYANLMMEENIQLLREKKNDDIGVNEDLQNKEYSTQCSNDVLREEEIDSAKLQTTEDEIQAMNNAVEDFRQYVERIHDKIENAKKDFDSLRFMLEGTILAYEVNKVTIKKIPVNNNDNKDKYLF